MTPRAGAALWSREGVVFGPRAGMPEPRAPFGPRAALGPRATAAFGPPPVSALRPPAAPALVPLSPAALSPPSPPPPQLPQLPPPNPVLDDPWNISSVAIPAITSPLPCVLLMYRHGW